MSWQSNKQGLMSTEVFFHITDHQMVACGWMPPARVFYLILSVLANSARKNIFLIYCGHVQISTLFLWTYELLNFPENSEGLAPLGPHFHMAVIWGPNDGGSIQGGRCSPGYSLLAPQHCGCCWPSLAIKLPALFPCHKVTRELKYFLYPSPSNLEQWEIHWEGTMLRARKGESKFLCRYDPHLLGKPVTSVQRDITIEDILGK